MDTFHYLPLPPENGVDQFCVLNPTTGLSLVLVMAPEPELYMHTPRMLDQPAMGGDFSPMRAFIGQLPTPYFPLDTSSPQAHAQAVIEASLGQTAQQLLQDVQVLLMLYKPHPSVLGNILGYHYSPDVRLKENTPLPGAQILGRMLQGCVAWSDKSSQFHPVVLLYPLDVQTLTHHAWLALQTRALESFARYGANDQELQAYAQHLGKSKDALFF